MTTNAPDTAPDVHHGYRLTKVRRVDSRGGIGFSGVLTRYGTPVADVHQAGNGGQALVRFYDARTGEPQAFDAAAKTIFGAEEFEPTEALLWRLEEADQLSRARTGVFVLGQDEVDRFYSDGPQGGTYRRAPGTRPADLLRLLLAHHRDQDPFVWSKEAATFVRICCDPVERSATGRAE